MRKKKGISLIVLVITIIVMIILAAAIIISISNSGIVNRANSAVDKTNEKQMKELVSLAWAEAYLKDTTEAKDDAYFYDEVISYLKANGITDEELAKYDITADKNGADANLKTKNEYGFYFDKLYAGTMTQGSYTFDMGMVFRKNQTVEIYVQGSVAFQLEVDGADNLFYQSTEQVTYAKNQVIFTNEDGTTDTLVFENEGSTIDVVGYDLTLNSQEVRGAYYNKYAVGSVNVSGTEVAIKGILYNDNTMEFTIGTSSQTADVQIAANGHYITGENISAVYVSVDGKYLVSSYSGSKFLLEFEESTPDISDTPDEPQANLIPEGGTYYVGVTAVEAGDYTGATATYTAGQAFPQTVNAGDVYVYGDYEYRYNMVFDLFTGWNMTEANTEGWGVYLLDRTKTSYEPAIYKINNNLITNMSWTYAMCANLIEAPTIPSGVKNLTYAFYSCQELTTAQTIPNSATNLNAMFKDCINLRTYVGSNEEEGEFSNYIIPNGVTDISSIFSGCSAVTSAFAIPSSVVDMTASFSDCTSLAVAPNMTNAINVENMDSTFSHCEKLKTAPSIIHLTKLVNMSNTFSSCFALENAPAIPSKVTDMSRAFGSCSSLVAPPDMLNALSVTTLESAFNECIVLTSAPNLTNCINLTDMQQTFLGCTALKSVNIIPASVNRIDMAFYNCSNLEGNITVNINNTECYVNACFYNTEKAIMLTGSAPNSIKEALAGTALKDNVTY